MRSRFIAAEKAQFPVRTLCRLMQVTRSGFYAWQRRAPSTRVQQDVRLVQAIEQVHTANRQTYGSPRIHRELRAQGHACGRHRVARLMRQAGVRAKQQRRIKATTDSRHDLPVAPNLLARQFQVAAANRVWVADITYVATGEGWLYLAAVLDLHSRRIVGWSMDERMTRQLVIDALNAAVARRQPAPGLLHHSDRGSQYASHDYQALLKRHGMQPSMSGKGNCWDNAVMESFFHTLKTELTYHQRYATRRQARAAIFEYIEAFYNRRRRHSFLGYLSPAEFESMAKAA